MIRRNRLATVALVLSGLSMLLSAGLYADEQRDDARDESEAAERRDQTCHLFETDHKADVDDLRGRYNYLSGLSRAQLREPINAAVLQQLSTTEREARADSAPDYCDEPGIAAERRGAKPTGLPEPDPIVPERPSVLDPP